MRRPRARESEVAGVSKGFDAVLRAAFAAGYEAGLADDDTGDDDACVDEAYADWQRGLSPSRGG
jgi:hypothetical protein